MPLFSEFVNYLNSVKYSRNENVMDRFPAIEWNLHLDAILLRVHLIEKRLSLLMVSAVAWGLKMVVIVHLYGSSVEGRERSWWR